MIEKPHILLSLVIGLSLLTGCDFNSNNKHLERQIRSEALKESSGIATLAAIYTLSFVHFEENTIQSDDFYIQKDIVNIDYGFDLDDNSIKVVDENGRKKLKIRLGKGDILGVNRTSLRKPETSHEGYLPKNAKTGELVNVDEKMNLELEELKKLYGDKNLKHARDNAKNFFKILAAKYGLELDFE